VRFIRQRNDLSDAQVREDVVGRSCVRDAPFVGSLLYISQRRRHAAAEHLIDRDNDVEPLVELALLLRVLHPRQKRFRDHGTHHVQAHVVPAGLLVEHAGIRVADHTLAVLVLLLGAQLRVGRSLTRRFRVGIAIGIIACHVPPLGRTDSIMAA
jgi:hypothetical protein